MKKRIVSLFLALVMALSLIPTTVWAEVAEGSESSLGSVHVIVENTTYSVAEDGAPWDGTLVDAWVALQDDSTVMNCVKRVLDLKGFNSTGADSGYISEINGLSAGDGSSGSGWMGTLNDWFTNEGFGGFTVAQGTLEAGDEIRIMFTMTMGQDIGGSWENTDKTVKSVVFSAGTLSTPFDKDTDTYYLTVPEGVSSVSVTPTASNKNYQVRTSVEGVEYKRSAQVPVADGKVITVKCGDPSWPSMNTNTDEAKTYTFIVKQEGETPVPPVAEPQDVTFKGLHDAQLAYLEVYSVGDDTKNLLEDVERAADGYNYKYETKLAAGDYIVKGYDADKSFNGSLVLTVEPGIKNEFKLQRVYQIYASNSGWALDEDYTLDVKLISADNQVRTIQLGKADCWGTVYASCIFVVGDTVEATVIPTEKHTGCLAATVKQTPELNCGISAKIEQGHILTVRAPQGSVISAGIFRNYWHYEFAEAETVTIEDGNVVATFLIPEVAVMDMYMNYNYHFVRVQNSSGVTYWDFGKWNEDTEITLSAEDLHIEDSAFQNNTVIEDFNSNTYDLGNIYLNINSQGYKNMAEGETYTLNVFRNWQAIESFMNKKIALPDVHYQVIGVNGKTSDVVTITPDADNSSVATMTANKPGTAIVLVTYDAMTHVQADGGKELSAIWPEFTGVFVVTVGLDGTGIQTNMTMTRPGSTATIIDAEHDILFYAGDEGAEYSFTPESGCTVTVARSTVDDAMTFNGFTSSGVTVAEDGTVTVSGLTTGRHIIKVEKNGVANYQVITARGVSYDLLDAEGNVLSMDAELTPGDTVKIQFKGLVNPVEKMAGVYNRNPALVMEGEDGTAFANGASGGSGVYTFSSDAAKQLITITIPKDASGLSYTLNGAIKALAMWGAKTGAHRAAAYGVGLGKYSGTAVGDIMSRLPELTLKLEGYSAFYGPIEEAETLIDAIGTVSRNSADAIAAARTAYDALSGEQKALVSNYEVLTAAEAMLAALELQYVYQTTGDYLSGKGTPIVGSIGGEWLTIGLARSGRTVPEGYYDNAVAYVKAKINTTTNRLDRNKSTDNARLILALTAIGKDVTDVGGFDLLAGLDDMKYVKRQGTNGPVWTLIALDSHGYTPAGSVTRDALVETILSLQKDSGAWYINSTSTTDDVDMTAMAIQALAPYYKTNEAVKAAVDKALTWLSTMQKSDGSFAEMAGAASSSESTAQVLVALCALGIDPTADARFAKNSFHVVDGLLTFYTGEAFKHQLADATVDQMGTEQSYYALAAYMRLTGGRSFLYDMNDVCIKHVFGEWTVTKAATCTEAGVSTRTCTVCGAEETLTVPALGHKFGEWTVTKAATCTETGVSTRTCTVCGEAKETKDIPALGHKAGTVYAMDKDSHWLTCTVCGAVLTKESHTYVQGVQCVCGLMKTNDSTVKKVEVKADVSSTVADNEKLNTPEKVKSTLQLEISRENNAITEKNTVMMEVTLTVTENGVSRPATKDDLTGGRITVLLPYPSEVAGDYRSYSFTVAHLVTMAGCGKDVGTVEFPAAVMTADGLLVTLTGLSPVAISYTERSSSGGGSGSGGITVVKPTSANTADDSQMTIWMGSAILAAAAVVVLTQKKKRASK